MLSYSTSLRVLIVDDYRDAADSLALLLRAWGHDVRVAHDGPTALELAATYLPHVVFLDVALPGMNGFAVAREMRRRDWPVRPVLVSLSGLSRPEDQQRSRESGCDWHLTKPADPEEVRRLLQTSRGCAPAS
jgi:CheY-like chemotaxis protein